MNANSRRSSEIETLATSTSDDLESSLPTEETGAAQTTLASLPIGARLVVRCRADWREAIVASVSSEFVALTVCAPSGRTYRTKRPPDSPITFNGSIPLLGEGAWRENLSRTEKRW